MQSVYRFLSGAAFALLSASSFAATTVYTSSASFLSQVAPGYYTESFNGLASDASMTFASGGFSYTISTPTSPFPADDIIGTNFPDEALTVTFTSGNVTALGGDFFAVNFSNAFKPSAMTVTLSDGTVVLFTPTSLGASFRGFTSDLAITSLVISPPDVAQSFYAALDNLTVGTTIVDVPAVPEPTTWALMGLGLAGIAVAARRKA